ADRLAGWDLRGASLTKHILPSLEGGTARGPRIAVLKRLYSYLRKVTHRISREDDPTLETLTVPQSRPEQWKRVKSVPSANVGAALEHLSNTYKDALLVLAGTGWHVTEIIRFARTGSIEASRQAESKDLEAARDAYQKALELAKE